MPRLPYLLLIFLQVQVLLSAAQPGVNDSLLHIVRENKQDTTECKALVDLAQNYARTDLEKEGGMLYRALPLAVSLKDNTMQDAIYELLMSMHLETGHIDSAKYYLAQLKRMADEKACLVCVTSYYARAGLFYKRLGKYHEALDFMLKSLKENEDRVSREPSVAARTNLAGQYMNIGNVYNQFGDYTTSLRYHLNSLKLFEKVSNKKGISFCYQNIGSAFLMIDQLGPAREYTQKGIELKTELGDRRGMGTGYKQLGDIWLACNKYDSALADYRQALKIDESLKLLGDEVGIYSDMAQAYAGKHDEAGARQSYSQSRTVALEVGDSTRVAAIDGAVAALETTIKKERTTEKQLMSSLNTSIEQGDMNSRLLDYKYIADHYSSIGQYDKALDYMTKYYGLNDSLTNKDIQVQFKRLEEQYNLGKKESEIALLKKDQELTHLSLQKQKTFQLGAVCLLVLLVLIAFLVVNRYRVVHNARRLIEMEKMRNRIARDLHDDIGSTLTSINVLSNVALKSPEKDDLMMRANLQKIKDRSSAIMESMSDIVWAINPQNDTMEQLLLRMKEFASEILEPLNINYEFEERGDFASLRLDIKKRKDIYLLFKEAVNNAAKYSRCHNLHIRLIQDHHSLRMEIADDGMGFVEKEVRNGNGLTNMRERAASMQAEIMIDPAVGKGTRIALDLPIT